MKNAAMGNVTLAVADERHPGDDSGRDISLDRIFSIGLLYRDGPASLLLSADTWKKELIWFRLKLTANGAAKALSTLIPPPAY